MSWVSRGAAAFLVGLSCLLPTSGAPGALSALDRAIDEETLRNGSFELPDVGAVELVDGRFERRYGDGATQVDRVSYVAGALATLDHGGGPAAAVVLAVERGGSGVFVYLAAVLDDAGAPRQGGVAPLGDRVQVNGLAIQGSLVVASVQTHAPTDPLCCPSQDRTLTFRWEADVLELVSSEEARTAPIVGAVWKWERFSDNADGGIVVADPDRYTLTLNSDGTYRVRADCNLASGAYVTEGSRLTLSPGPATLAACEPGSLYDAFLGRLAQVVTYVQRDDRLVLNLFADSGDLIFGR